MIHLLLARHGETDWNAAARYQGQADPALNQAGRRQAYCLAARLARWKVDVIYGSDLQRARETATIIAKALHTEPVPEPRLRELSFGVIEGLTFAEAKAHYPAMMTAWLEDGQQPPLGGETMDAFARRLLSFFDDLKHRHEGQAVLLVTHGGPIRELLRLALGLAPQGHWYFAVDNGSLSELVLYGDQPLLRQLNDTSHLNGSYWNREKE